MEMRDSLIAVTRAVAAATDSTGPSSFRPHVERLVKGDASAKAADFYEVAGMQLGDFYSHSQKAFPENEEELWETVQANLDADVALRLDGQPQVKLPKPGQSTTIAQIAVLLNRQRE